MRLLGLALLGVIAVCGIVAYAFLKPPAEASGPIQSVALEARPTSSSATLFEIEPEESRARFVIDEVLRGAPKTVVGETGQVAGQIAVNPTDPESTQIGTITVNARTFATDSGQRDRAVQNQILQTEQHEYVSFKPTELVGLPDGTGLGESMSFRVVGDLTIRGVTRPATFDATVTPSAERLQGRATTTIRYADWGIQIPRVPSVAGVSETVRLELDFVATTA